MVDSHRPGAVRDALDALPASLRMVVHLHRFEGLFARNAKCWASRPARESGCRAYAILRERLRPLVQEGS